MAKVKIIVNDQSSQDSVRIIDADAIERIRMWLIDNRYAESATRALTKDSANDQAAAKIAAELPAVRLLLGGSPLTLAEAKKLFTSKDLKEWIDAGLLAKTKKRVLPLVRITPFRKLFIVSDREWTAEARSRPDLATGLTSNSIRLADFTIRRDARCTLDVGTGIGVQAMLAAKHSEQVVATDSNSRALEFARFNAALNGIDNIEFIEGDLFEAVAGRTFDLILSNPPFSMSPASSCLDDGQPMDSDESVKQFIQTVPVFLNNGGYAQIVCNWIQASDESWMSRLSESLKSSGCDAWILRDQSSSPADYARMWLDGYDSSNAEKLSGDWISCCEKQAIASIDGGLITMRRSDGRQNWLRVDAELPRIYPDAGAHVARCFWLQDFLAGVRGAELLNEILYLLPGVELAQTSKPTINGWKPHSCQFTMTRGIGYVATLDPAIMRVVAACNGRLQLGRLLEAVAAADGEDLEVIATRYLGAIQKLVMLGFLLPARHGFNEDSKITDSKSDQLALDAGCHAAEIICAATHAQGCDEEEARSA